MPAISTPTPSVAPALHTALWATFRNFSQKIAKFWLQEPQQSLAIPSNYLLCLYQTIFTIKFGCIQQLKLFFDHTVSKLSAKSGSLWNTVKQVSRLQIIHKTQPPICLDYRAHKCYKRGFGLAHNNFEMKIWKIVHCDRKRELFEGWKE